MQFITLLAPAFALFATTFASPAAESYGNKCVTQQQAESVVNKIINIFEHLPNTNAANATAQALLAPNFQEFSDSILALEGRPVRTPLWSTT